MEPQKPQKVNLETSEKSKKIINSFKEPVKKFYDFHGIQLLGSEFPVPLIEQLYNKLTKGVYDSGDYFQILDNQEEEQFEVKAKKSLVAEGNVFIIDHALTFRYPDLRKLLSQNTNLIPRLLEMLKYHKEMKKLPNEEQDKQKNPIESVVDFAQIQFDSMELNELSHLEFPANTLTVSLISNNLYHEQELIKKISVLNLKVLWVNDNPIQDSESLQKYIDQHSSIEIFNSKFTKHCTQWGLKYAHKRNIVYAFSELNQKIFSLNLADRNIYNINVDLLMKFPNLRKLNLKDHKITSEQDEEVFLNILNNNKSLRFLEVDFDVEIQIYEMATKKKLNEDVMKKLLINGHSLIVKEPTQTEYKIDTIQNSLFKVSGNYRLASSQKLDESSVWYVNDEVGTAITHNDNPNIKLIPFLFSQDNKMGQNMIAYSILWPLKSINEGQLVNRDYLHGFSQKKQRSSRLSVWYELPFNYYSAIVTKFNKNMQNLAVDSVAKLTSFYSQNTVAQQKMYSILKEKDELYFAEQTVITDNETILDNLTSPDLKIVKKLEEATVIWMSGPFSEEIWEQYKDKYYTNQFPFESCVVMKHNLANTIQTVFGNTPYLMRTYDLEKELPEFLGDFNERDKKGQDNLWILKPPNMARSLDMIITDNLPLIIKNMQTGPKIAQKYISNPVLRRGRKVDLRYVLLVKSINPLILFLYKHFWIRSSNNPYTLDRRTLSTYETQFTVMNYGNVSDFKQIPYKEFIEEFQKDYAPHKWQTIDEKIKKMLRNTFIAAASKYPQMHNEKSRALYGIDIMIDEETMQPKLLQITFSPDCKRACQYYPEFFNEVFETLYLNIPTENMERII